MSHRRPLSVTGTVFATAALLMTSGCAVEEEPERVRASSGEIVIAVLHPDDDTTITFLESDTGGEEQIVDVVIKGRDGGLDYGSAITAGATPLQLFVAIAGEGAEVPPELERDHDRELQRRATTGVQPLIDPGQIVNITTFGNSICQNFANFKDEMSDQFVGAPGRNQKTSKEDTGVHSLYSPSTTGSWNLGQADTYVCNYNSPGANTCFSATRDCIDAELCHWNTQVPGSSPSCYSDDLDDGYYMRRVYGATANNRRYWGTAQPWGAPALLNFIGLVRRD
jgi:hypothetical protein